MSRLVEAGVGTASRRVVSIFFAATGLMFGGGCSHDYGFLDDARFPTREPRAAEAGTLDGAGGGDGSLDSGGGWMDDGMFGCAPGQRVRVGCNASCGAGTCTGDPVLRVCDGNDTAVQCEQGTPIAENDDACGTVCPSADVTCPPSGRVRVVSRPYHPGATYTCNVDVVSPGSDAGAVDTGVDACRPACGGRVCGPDPICGSSCGNCPAGTSCDATGQCVCAPNCAGRSCGSDGCGGSCGTCPTGRTCSSSGNCVCVPMCSGRVCGPNGCGGTCGTCPGARTCNTSGQCVCVSLAGVCASNADCCTGVCDPGYACGRTPRCCLPEGSRCTTNTQCCSDTCVGGVCQFVGCA